MIQRIRARAYRSLHFVDLDLSPRVTAIVGPSDQGKSNVVRALRDLFFGARGAGLVERGEKAAEVEVELDDGRAVNLRKGGKVNELMVLFPDGPVSATRTFSGHGSVTPKEVQDVLGVREVEVDRGVSVRPNLVEQLDRSEPFLLREPGSVVARVIGLLSGLHVVHAAVREAQADAQARDRDAAAAEEAERSAIEREGPQREKVERYRGAREEAASLLKGARKAEDAATDLSVARERLSRLLDQLEDAADSARRLEPSRAAREQLEVSVRGRERAAWIGEDLGGLDRLRLRVDGLRSRRDRLSRVVPIPTVVSEVDRVASRARGLGQALRGLDHLIALDAAAGEKHQALSVAPALCANAAAARASGEKADALREAARRERLHVREVDDAVARRDAAERELEAARRALRAVPACPLCGSRLGEGAR